MKGYKLENLPGVKDIFRKTILDKLTTMDAYLEDLKKGLPFFSEQELIEIEEKFKKGMTQNDILAEIYKKGWPFKENTLKHYIQINQIPRAERREGKISYYPANTIRHLNFTRYCIFSGSETAKELTSFFNKLKIKDKNIVIEKSDEAGRGTAGNDCLHALWIGLSRTEEAIGWTEEAIELAFANDQTKKTMYLKELDKINNCADKLEKMIKNFLNLLEKNTSPIKLRDSEEKEKNNEAN